MFFESENTEDILGTSLSRRELLTLGATIPFLNSFNITSRDINKELSSLIKLKGVITISKIATGKIIACSNIKKAVYPKTIGSIAKVFTSLALLNNNLITENTLYNCKGRDIINGKIVDCWHKPGHGLVNIEKAIAKSCNLFFYKNIQALSINKILETYNLLKLNRIEPIEYAKTENNNYLSWLNHLYSQDFINDIGLGLLPEMKLSQLQLISGVSTIAREGIYYPLHLNNTSTNGHKISINRHNLSIVRNGMILSSKEGTSKLLGKYNYKVAAKTGTATNDNINNGKNHGWCVGYIPYNKPKIAFSVMIENGTGYSDAVPYTLKTLNLCKEFGYF